MLSSAPCKCSAKEFSLHGAVLLLTNTLLNTKEKGFNMTYELKTQKKLRETGLGFSTVDSFIRKFIIIHKTPCCFLTSTYSDEYSKDVVAMQPPLFEKWVRGFP